MRILTNHLGYDCGGPKHAVVQVRDTGDTGGHAGRGLGFRLVRVRDGETVFAGACTYRGQVDGWTCGRFYTLEFDEVNEAGRFRLEIVWNNDGTSANAGDEAPRNKVVVAVSEPFEIAPGLLFRETFSNVLSYFKGQRCGGDEDVHDRAAAFHGERSDLVDVRGGWFDASGDTSKYLSHLSYANYLNPQQTPAVVWAMLEAREVLKGLSDGAPPDGPPPDGPPRTLASALPALWERRLREEAAWGADFLARMQDEHGYFYMTVFDRWSKSLEERIISSFRTQQGHRGSDYQAGMRQGGGMAVAALARAAACGISGDFDAERYLDCAVRGFEHLADHNTEYLDDGRENIIDDYCGLLAAAELFAATSEKQFLEAARERFGTLWARFGDGSGSGGAPEGAAAAAADAGGDVGAKPAHWYADAPGGRAYYHAAEAGLPVLAILRYADVERDSSKCRQARSAARRAIAAELAVTEAVTNPFGYARQYVSVSGASSVDSFFIPHTNESGYWWQGENARLASLAAAALWAKRRTTAPGPAAAEYAQNQLNWILGLNPLDICMMDGVGRNNPEYSTEFPNAPGGICNGITGGFEDESDLAFLPEPAGSSPFHRWRWSEQWIPHAGWFLLAVTLSFSEHKQPIGESNSKEGVTR